MKKIIKIILFGLVTALLLGNFIFFIHQNSLNMPFWDEWDVIDPITQPGGWWNTIIHQHNEHRIGVGLTLMKILAPLTHWNQLVETAVVALEIIGSCCLVLYVKKKISGEISLLDLVIPFIFLNIFQWGNILFAFQITFVLPLVFLCLGIWALTVEDLNKRNSLLVLFSLLGAFSSFHGLFIPIVFILFLLTETILNRFKHWKISLLTIIAEILIIAAYFWGYEKKFQAAINLKPNFAVLDFFSALLSNGFFYHASVSQNFGFRYFLAGITLAAFFYGAYRLIILKKNWVLAMGLIFIGFAVLFAASITFGRSAFGMAQASETRYITFTMLIPLGIYFILQASKNKNILSVLLILLLLGGWYTYPKNINKSVRSASKARNQAAACYQTKKPENYSACFKIAPLYPDENRIDSLMLGVLKYKGLSQN